MLASITRGNGCSTDLKRGLQGIRIKRGTFIPSVLYAYAICDGVRSNTGFMVSNVPEIGIASNVADKNRLVLESEV